MLVRSVRRLARLPRPDLDHPDLPASLWSGIEVSECIKTTGNKAGGTVRVHADSLAPGADVDAADHDAEQAAPPCAQARLDALDLGPGVDLTVDAAQHTIADRSRLRRAGKHPAIIRDAKCHARASRFPCDQKPIGGVTVSL